MRFSGGLTVAAVVLAGALAAAATCGGDERGGSGAVSGEGPAGEAPTARPQRPSGDGTDVRRRRRGASGAPSDGANAETGSDGAGAAADPWAGRKALLQGVVRWPDGTPAADALVTLGDLEDAYEATTSAADGTFGIDEFVSYGCVEAFAVRGGEAWRGRVPADGAPLDLDIQMTRRTRPFERLIRVVGWDGGSVDGGHARVLRRGGGTRWDSRAVAISGGRFIADGSRNDDERAALYVVTAACDAEGRPLPYGPALVDAERLDALVTEIRLPPGVSLRGRVVGPDGAPVSAAKVELSPPPPEGHDADHMPRWIETTHSDEDGTFAFAGLPRGRGRLFVIGPRALAARDEVEVECGADAEVVVRLPARIAATVTVKDPSGAPIPSTWIVCDEIPDRVSGWTGADGALRLEQLRPDVPRALVAEHAVFHVRASLAAWVPADTTIVLVPAFPIAGTVTDAAGRPLPEARLFAERRRPESPDGTVRIDADGSFRVPDMAEGDEAELRLTDGMSRVVASAVAPAGAKDVRLVWDDPGRFGVVFARDADDTPTGGPAVTLRAEGRDVVSSGSSSAIVTFETAGLPARVDVQVGPFRSRRFALLRDVEPRGLLRVPPEAWRAGREIVGTVTGPDGEPSPRAVSVTITDGAGFSATVRVGGRGGYTCVGAPTTPLELRVTTDAGPLPEVHPVEAREGTTSVQVRLRE